MEFIRGGNQPQKYFLQGKLKQGMYVHKTSKNDLEMFSTVTDNLNFFPYALQLGKFSTIILWDDGISPTYVPKKYGAFQHDMQFPS